MAAVGLIDTTRKASSVLIALLGLAMTMATAHAGLVKWVDGNGKVHYGDKPPTDGSRAERVVTAPPPLATSNKTNNRAPSQQGRQAPADQGFDPCRPLPPGMYWKGQGMWDEDIATKCAKKKASDAAAGK